MHFFAWRILVIALPAVFFLSLYLRPAQPVMLDSKDVMQIRARLQGDTGTLITIDHKNLSNLASCQLLGQIRDQEPRWLATVTTTSPDTFLIPYALDEVVLFDAVHDKEIHKVAVSMK